MSRSHLAKQRCTLVLFGFTIADFLDDPCARDHHVVELWSGVESIVRAARKKGLTAAPFDKFRCSDVTKVSEDILTKDGFRAAVRYVLRLVVGGLLWMAPVCSSFGFLNCSNCKRSEANNWRGDTTYPPVQDGNLGTDVACFLFWLAWAREVEVAMENPSGNNFWKYGSVVCLVDHLKLSTSLVSRCSYDTAPFGERPKKQYNCLATGPWIEKTARKCRCPTGAHKNLVIRNAHGDRGMPDELKASGAYPTRLGVAIVAAWDGWRQDSEVGSGVVEHRPGGSSRRRWAKSASDSSDVPVSGPAGRACEGQQSSSSAGSGNKSGVPVHTPAGRGCTEFRCSSARSSASSRAFPQSSSDESPRPERPSGSKRKWLQASDSE